jgi:Cd(II)/Pb(II)-responsive transcriptional regulator
MQIGELAKQAEMKVDTVRYYEKAGLLPPPPRQSNGYRDYATSHLQRLTFIRHCRDLDISLDEIRQMLDFITHPDADCITIDHLIENQLTRVRERIANLCALESQLLKLRSQCKDRKTVSECGILRELGAMNGHSSYSEEDSDPYMP